jgi:glycolate oxidase iron-sulfur subunit
VALARKGMEGELNLGLNLFAKMYACFGCLACDDICPVGIHPSDLVMKMRHVQEQLKPSLWKSPFFDGIVLSQKRMETASFPLRLYQTSGLRRMVYAMGLRWLLPGRVRDMEAMLPRIPLRPLRRILPEVTTATGKESRTVGFFLGCAQSLLFAQESAATVGVLALNGCTVITPKDAVCCGMPAIGYGRRDTAKGFARRNIAIFEKANIDVIVTDCATCGSTLKKYGELLSDDPAWAKRAASFSKKVKDINEFLMEIPLRKPEGRIEARVTYHDPCHLGRAQGVYEQPRKLLGMIDGIDLLEMEEADWCCGSAGSQIITHHETSLMVLDRKMDNIEATKAHIVASGCPGCRMQLNAGIKRRGLDINVVHPVLMLYRAYAGKGK